ncbi:MAG: LysM peptidoglycan-binding domain-containing protein [Planctomycetes bacterium]|nr:LysM peptidoglycan-binding domain-containing protein [Planctomycetota bacterium]
MRRRVLLAFVVVPCAFVACGESHAKPRSGDGTLVLEVGGNQPSLREALQAAGVELAPPARPNVDATPQPEPKGPTTPPREQSPPPAVDTPPAPTFFEVEMKAGDSLILLARRHLGNGNRFRELLELNGWSEQDALSLRPGTKVKVPRRPAANSGR